jgi:Tfp pilus assembly protein PilO
MWKKLEQYSVWLISVPLIGALVGYMLCFYLPGRRDVRALRDQLRATEATIQEAEMFVAMIPAVQAELDRAQEYNRTWGERIPREGQIVGVFGSISRLASEVGTSPSRFAPEKVVDLRYLRQVPLDLACSGEFKEIREFIHRIEGLPQFVWIDQINLSSVSATDEETRKITKCDMKLVLFGGQVDISN